MNTKAAIGMIDEQGKVLGIICMYDGYIQGIGKILHQNYNAMSPLLKLLDLGTILKLGPTPEETTVSTSTTGLRWIEPRSFQSVSDFERYFQVADYFYLYESPNWTVKQNLKESTPYTLLEFALL